MDYFFLQKDTELSEKYELKKYLSSSIKGLQYLKDIYSMCNQNVSRIELIIEKIKS